MPITKKIALFAGAVLLLGFVIWAVLLMLGSRERSRAEAFLNDLTNFKLGEATFTNAEWLARRYGGKPWSALPQKTTCTSKECSLSFEFQNPRNHLPFLLAPRVALNGIVTVKDDRVVGIELGYQVDSNFGGRAAYDLRDTLIEVVPSTDERYRWVSPGYGIARLKVASDGRPRVIEVRLNEQATREERRQAYSFDLSCLGKLFGCSSRTIFPPPWQD